jgi:hypothetical protein
MNGDGYDHDADLSASVAAQSHASKVTSTFGMLILCESTPAACTWGIGENPKKCAKP